MNDPVTARRNLISESLVSFTCFALVLLWTYAAVSKLADYGHSKQQMMSQVFPHALSEVLAWLVPAAELIAAGLLTIARTRLIGLYGSLLLIISFTGYIGLALLRVFSRLPCSCGGILDTMSWQVHFAFNLVFVLLTALAVRLHPHVHNRFTFNKKGGQPKAT